MVCVCFVWSVVDDDGLLDYVQVLHQFSFVALNQQTALRVNLEINAFAMQSVLNDLAEAMKALDGKISLPPPSCPSLFSESLRANQASGWTGWSGFDVIPFLDKIGIFHKQTMDGETVGDFKPNIFVNLDCNHRVVLVAKC